MSMNEAVTTLAFYGTALIYPVASGPLAALAFDRGLLARWRGFAWWSWPGLALLHLMGFYFVTYSLGEGGVGPGFVACLITPVAAAATALAMRLRYRRLLPSRLVERSQQHNYKLANLFIPSLQLFTTVMVLLLAPGR